MNSAIGGTNAPCSRRIDEDRRHDADPAAAPDRPGPVATIGDPAVPGEDREPEQRNRP